MPNSACQSQSMWTHRICAIMRQKIPISSLKSRCIISRLMFGAECDASVSYHEPLFLTFHAYWYVHNFFIHLWINSQKMNDCMDISDKIEQRHPLFSHLSQECMRRSSTTEQLAEAVQFPGYPDRLIYLPATFTCEANCKVRCTQVIFTHWKSCNKTHDILLLLYL